MVSDILTLLTSSSLGFDKLIDWSRKFIGSS